MHLPTACHVRRVAADGAVMCATPQTVRHTAATCTPSRYNKPASEPAWLGRACDLTRLLQMMRPLEDEATAEHNERRRMLATLASSSVDLQLCDLDGVCNTDMLLELGPEVYSKAQELIAMAAGAATSDRRGRGRGSLNAALTPLPQLADKGVKRVAFWDARWPQFGDEVDGEMQYLRCFSWACWQALHGVASSEEYAQAIACTDTMERILRAIWKFSEHKKEILRAQLVLDTLQNVAQGEEL